MDQPLKNDKARTHGACITDNPRYKKAYRTRRGMINRCYNSNEATYPKYGGRGIQVCQRWLDSFENFCEDMGLPPSMDHSIERIDNYGDYSPKNCRWATRMEQTHNRRSSVLIEINGERKVMTEWCRHFGMIGVGTAWWRIQQGWNPELAVSTGPMRGWSRKKGAKAVNHESGNGVLISCRRS